MITDPSIAYIKTALYVKVQLNCTQVQKCVTGFNIERVRAMSVRLAICQTQMSS